MEVTPLGLLLASWRPQSRVVQALSFPQPVLILTELTVHKLTEILQAWSDCVSFGAFEAYRDRFEKIQRYFAPRFPEAVRVGNEMIKTILEKTANSAT
jgi:hypothetical protein